jgi:hypothetical protein
MTGKTDYSKLLEPMTAREHVTRFDPHLFDLFTEKAATVAAEYGLPPSPAGVYPRVVWDMALRYVPAYKPCSEGLRPIERYYAGE